MGTFKKKTDNGELEFTRAACDTLEDARLDGKVDFKHAVWPTSQRGVLAFVTTVRIAHAPELDRPIITQTDYWPSATDLSWAAFWFQHSFKTARMVEAWLKSEEERVSEQGT
jgi:hypothetical protein